MSKDIYKRTYVEGQGEDPLCGMYQRTLRQDRVFLVACTCEDSNPVVLFEPEARKLRDDLTAWLNGDRWGAQDKEVGL